VHNGRAYTLWRTSKDKSSCPRRFIFGTKILIFITNPAIKYDALLGAGPSSLSNQCLSVTDRKKTGGLTILIEFRPILKEKRCNLSNYHVSESNCQQIFQQLFSEQNPRILSEFRNKVKYSYSAATNSAF